MFRSSVYTRVCPPRNLHNDWRPHLTMLHISSVIRVHVLHDIFVAPGRLMSPWSIYHRWFGYMPCSTSSQDLAGSCHHGLNKRRRGYAADDCTYSHLIRQWLARCLSHFGARLNYTVGEFVNYVLYARALDLCPSQIASMHA